MKLMCVCVYIYIYIYIYILKLQNSIDTQKKRKKNCYISKYMNMSQLTCQKKKKKWLKRINLRIKFGYKFNYNPKLQLTRKMISFKKTKIKKKTNRKMTCIYLLTTFEWLYTIILNKSVRDTWYEHMSFYYYN